jgi:AbrB family looped-hinge helix DNA binding protein
MREIVSTVTSKGQVTIPAEIRRYLGLKQGDKLSFVIGDSGTVELQLPRYPTVASVAGKVKPIDHDLSYSKIRDIAYEDRLEAKYGKGG